MWEGYITATRLELTHEGCAAEWGKHAFMVHTWLSGARASSKVLRRCRGMPPAVNTCNETVVYAFLAQGTLPLWPVWESYLAGCPNGSSTVVVHTQGSLSERTDLTMKLAGVGGSLLPAELTLYGNPTYSYKMVAMTLALYRYIDQANVRTPDGCSPRFIHLSSERDAPVATCAAVRARLAVSRGRSLVEVQASEAKSSVEPLPGCKRLPVGSTGFYYASQWTTLDATHAFALATNEANVRDTWELGCSRFIRTAPDERYFIAELTRRGFEVEYRGLTWVEWGSGAYWCETGCSSTIFDPNAKEGQHPLAFLTGEAASIVSQRARQRGYFFARKFAAVPEVLSALSAIAIGLPPTPPVPPIAPPLADDCSALARRADARLDLSPPRWCFQLTADECENFVADQVVCFLDGDVDCQAAVNSAEWFTCFSPHSPPTPSEPQLSPSPPPLPPPPPLLPPPLLPPISIYAAPAASGLPPSLPSAVSHMASLGVLATSFAAASVYVCWKLLRQRSMMARHMQRSAVGQRWTGPSARYARAITQLDDENEFTGVQLDCQLGEGPFLAIDWATVAAMPDEIPAAPCATADESTLVPQTDSLCQVRAPDALVSALATIHNDVALIPSELSPPPLEASESLPDPLGVPLPPLSEASFPSLHVVPNLAEPPLPEVDGPPGLSLPVLLSEAPLLPMLEPAPQISQGRPLPPLPGTPLPQLPEAGPLPETESVGVVFPAAAPLSTLPEEALRQTLVPVASCAADAMGPLDISAAKLVAITPEPDGRGQWQRLSTPAVEDEDSEDDDGTYHL